MKTIIFSLWNLSHYWYAGANHIMEVIHGNIPETQALPETA